MFLKCKKNNVSKKKKLGVREVRGVGLWSVAPRGEEQDRGQRPAWGAGATGGAVTEFLPGASGTVGKGKASRRPGGQEGPPL